MSAPKIAVLYHSGYGHTERQAKAVVQGAKDAGGDVSLYAVDGDFKDWEALEAADALIFGAPTYMGGPSAQFKAFMDATSSHVFAAGFKWKNKLAAGFTNSASRAGDKSGVFSAFSIFAAQHSMIWVGLGLPPANNSSTGSEQDLNRLGYFLGAAAQSDADAGADVAPPEADLRTAAHLGARVTEVAKNYTPPEI